MSETTASLNPRFEELATLSFPGNQPTPESAATLRDELLFQRANWLPAPKDADFSLYERAYWPKAAISDGSWTPPVERLS